MPTAAILCRVSTPQQARSDRHGIPNQLRACRAYAEREGLTITGTFVDQISGASETRESFYRLLDEADQYDACVVYHVDRIGRDEEISHRFIRLLRESGLEVHAANRGLVENDFLTSIEIAMSAEERRNIKRRTTAGLIAIAMQGKLPTGLRAFGYTNIRGEHRVEINERDAPTVRRIYAASAAGDGYRTIMDALNAEDHPGPTGIGWNHVAVGRIITNTLYKGEYTWTREGRTYHLPVPAIVTPNEWRAAQKRRRGPPPKLGLDLTGFMRCGICGRSVNARWMGTGAHRHIYLRCASQAHGESCGALHARHDRIRPQAERALRSLLANRKRLEQLALQSLPQHDEKAAAVISELEAEEARLLTAMQKGYLEVDTYGTAVAEVRRRMVEARRTDATPPPVDELMEAARGATFRELLEISNATIFVVGDDVRIQIEL